MDTTAQDSKISEFETQQDAEQYDAWFKEQVDEGLQCDKLHTHDEVLKQREQARR